MHRICKIFEFESGHTLSKSEDRCRFPHGHSRRVEVVLAAESLDDNDMVCNFRWLKLALGDILDRLDHTMCINQADQRLESFRKIGAKLEVLPGQDPTSEVLARMIFEELANRFSKQEELTSPQGPSYRIPQGVRLERVRLWETSTSWAEFSA